MNKDKLRLVLITFFVIAMVVYVLNEFINIFFENGYSDSIKEYANLGNQFNIILSSENKDIEPIIEEFAEKENINLNIEYAGTLEIMDKLNSGEKYDAVWASDSIWLYMLNEDVSVSESKSTSINPVIFAIKEDKAESLGFIGKEIYTKDIVEAIKTGNLKFSMSNPVQTNSGATAYLGLLSTLAGNPEVLTEKHLNNPELTTELINLFNGLERSSGSEEFLEELFLKGSYEAVVTYESSIININKELESRGEETLYALYPVDGVSISDSPLAYIDNGNDSKKEEFLKIRDYILSDEGQKRLANLGRRTWFGGVNKNVNQNVFNPDWGIDTDKYIVPTKFPSTVIIQEALSLYQTELRKPTHTIFCLDYSGSMQGDGIEELQNAMSYILTQEKAKKDLIQFTEKDKITVIPFSTRVIDVWNTMNGEDTQDLLNNILELEPTGSTNLYDSSLEALEILEKESSNYNLSIVLMTDGLSNMGEYDDLYSYYEKKRIDIPIYSIMFGDAYEEELQKIADLTNAKVFDGKKDLLKAFKDVRGYN